MTDNLVRLEVFPSDENGDQPETLTHDSEDMVCSGILQDHRLRTNEAYFGVTRPAPAVPQTAEGLTGFDDSLDTFSTGNVRVLEAGVSSTRETAPVKQQVGRGLLHLVGAQEPELIIIGGVKQDQRLVEEHRRNLAHSHDISIPGTVRYLDVVETDKQPRHGVNVSLSLGVIFGAAKSYLGFKRGKHA